MTDRYEVAGAEGEFEPGSNGQVLRNLAGICSREDIDELELGLLAQLYEEVLLSNFPDRRLSVTDLTQWHRLWLGNVYPWAGQARSVNMAKDGFMFASAAQIPRLLDDFERNCLANSTPCHRLARADLVMAMAVTHVEFILIHPFREGNGRLSRLLADVMASQAGHEPLDYSAWESGKPAYISAIHAGMVGDYGPMCQCMEAALAPGNSEFSEPV